MADTAILCGRARIPVGCRCPFVSGRGQEALHRPRRAPAGGTGGRGRVGVRPQALGVDVVCHQHQGVLNAPAVSGQTGGERAGWKERHESWPAKSIPMQVKDRDGLSVRQFRHNSLKSRDEKVVSQGVLREKAVRQFRPHRQVPMARDDWPDRQAAFAAAGRHHDVQLLRGGLRSQRRLLFSLSTRKETPLRPHSFKSSRTLVREKETRPATATAPFDAYKGRNQRDDTWVG